MTYNDETQIKYSEQYNKKHISNILNKYISKTSN